MFTRKNAFFAAIVLFLSAILFACSPKPTARDSKADLQSWFEHQWPDTMSVVEYARTQTDGEGTKYTVHFKARVKFVKDTVACVSTCCGEVCLDRLIPGFHWLSKRSDIPRVVQKGDLFEMEGKYTYTRTDKGWVNTSPE